MYEYFVSFFTKVIQDKKKLDIKNNIKHGEFVLKVDPSIIIL